MVLARTEPPSNASNLRSRDARSMTPKSARWADLGLRVLSAAVLAPLALGCIWIGGTAFAVLVGLIAVGLSCEWLGLCGQRGSLKAAAPFVLLPCAVVLTELGSGGSALVLLIFATVAGIALGRGLSPTRPLAFGIPYFGLAAVALVWLRRQPQSGGVNVIVLLLIVWASDIGAYMFGRALGGPRLAPSISPGKTWSGAAGGLVAAAAVGLAASSMLGHRPLSWHPVGLAALIGVVAQAGDLFESRVKRHFGVKDSGNIIPGHGGLLDRMDAVLTAAPVAALLALVLGRGVVLWE